MDFGAPVAAGINPNQGIQTLSGLLNIKQQQQALQGQAAEVQQQQQSARQRAAIANIDWSKYDDGTGIVSTDKMIGDPSLRQAAGDQFLDIMKAGASIRGTQLENKKSLVGLNNDLRDQFGSMVGALRTDPDVIKDTPEGREKVKTAMDQFAQAGGPDAQRVAQIYGQVADHAPPGKLIRGVTAIQLQAQDASRQAAAQSPQFQNVGATQQQINPLAAGGENAPQGNLTNTIAPGRQPFTDQFGRVYTFNPQTNNYEPAQTATGGGANQPDGGGSQKPAGPGVSTPGDVQAIHAQTEANFANVNANRNAANLAPQQLDQIKNALNLSRQVNTGGNWTGTRAQIESNLSSIIPGLKSAQTDAAKVQELDKFLTRITNDSAKVLGQNPSTDAQRDSIAHQNAQVGYTPQAIQSVLKYGAAQTLAMQAKGNAQDAWLQQKGNGITNQHEFETSWRKAYDPVLFQLEVSTPEEQKKLIENLDPKEAASLKGKRAALRALGAQLQ